jgi:DNA-binding SARP family transcriptional activator
MLRIHLFGRIRVAFADEPSEVNLTPTAQRVLAYLLLQPHRFYQREVLAALCWGDRSEEQARACLNTALWRLRRSLEPDSSGSGTYLITTSSGEVGFNWDSEHWLDLTIFEACATRILSLPPQSLAAEQAQMLESILPLYAGDLFEGIYDDWAIQERERLLTYYLDCLAHLMHYYGYRSVYDQSLRFGQLILRRDPLREDIHRGIMRLYSQMGQRALSVNQYTACSDILATELGISPMPETQALLAQIMSGTEVIHPGHDKPTFPTLSGDRHPTTFEEAWHALAGAIQSLDAARHELTGAMRLIEHSLIGQADGRQGTHPGRTQNRPHEPD